jgi:hypothetical protein
MALFEKQRDYLLSILIVRQRKLKIMELTLFYRGILGSNKGKDEKQALRRSFHSQLSQFWLQNPLRDNRYLWDESDKLYTGEAKIGQTIGSFHFIPLVNEYLYFVADLQIQLLRSEPPGYIKAQSGDLDNRIKTLLDALRMPRAAEEIPKNDSPKDGEQPFFCLLEDDALINSFSVTTHRWLEPNVCRKEVILLVTARTSITRAMARNEHIAGNII